MSGLACCFHRDGAPASGADLDAVASRLAWRGGDGSGRRVEGSIAIATWHFWTTPEEVGERGPREAGEAGLLLAFDGRLDNREELARALAIESPGALSDAELALRAWLAWGEGALPRLLGPYAIVVAWPRERRVVLARDPIGNRGLAFHLGPGLLLAASDEDALAADPRVGRQLDDAMLARYFSFEDRVDGRTFFRGIEQLLPGELLRVGPERIERSLFYSPPLESGKRSGEEWQEAFRDTLRQAVACRLRTPGPAGILLSGGLDSTPIAAFAREARPAGRLDSFTWAFPAHPQCDERALARETAARFALEQHEIPCDDAGPLAGLPADPWAAAAADEVWPVHPGTPEQNAYRLFHQRTYAAARAAGTRVLLSGMGGDQLYSGAESFVADLWRQGRAADLLRELGWHWRHRRLGAAAFRDLLPARLLWWRRRLRRRQAAPWLAANALAQLPSLPPWPPWAREAPRPEQVLRLFDPTNAHGINVECYYALRLGVFPRYPWRDRRIIELALQLPGIELRNRNVKRPILRSALRQAIPQNVIDRASKTSFEPIFRQSLFGDGHALATALLDRAGARWPLFVKKSFVDRELLRVPSSSGALVIWTCLALELWLLRGEGAGV